MPAQNNWLSEHGRDQIDFYLESSDVFLIERRRMMRLMIDLFEMQFPQRSGLTLQDMGCGDGAVSKNIAAVYPQNSFRLLDGSGTMLTKARESFAAPGAQFIESTFEDYIESPTNEHTVDFFYSSMAIHHLPHSLKVRFYEKMYLELKFGGLFLNYDVVMPVSDVSEKWQFQMWRDWMNETLARNGKPEEIGKFDDLPAITYKTKPENKPAGLFDQLQWLREIGYRDADCFYKYGIFALFGGRKD